jgi:hypothetical protein
MQLVMWPLDEPGVPATPLTTGTSTGVADRIDGADGFVTSMT